MSKLLLGKKEMGRRALHDTRWPSSASTNIPLPGEGRALRAQIDVRYMSPNTSSPLTETVVPKGLFKTNSATLSMIGDLAEELAKEQLPSCRGRWQLDTMHILIEGTSFSYGMPWRPFIWNQRVHGERTAGIVATVTLSKNHYKVFVLRRLATTLLEHLQYGAAVLVAGAGTVGCLTCLC
jgi:hypothetical protein